LTDGGREVADRVADVLNPSSLGPLTMAVGTTIAGGGVRAVRMEGAPSVERAGINAIPDWCEATIDIRFPQGARYPSDVRETREAVVAAVREHIEGHVDREGWSYEIRELSSLPPVAMAPSFEEAASLSLVQQE